MIQLYTKDYFLEEEILKALKKSKEKAKKQGDKLKNKILEALEKIFIEHSISIGATKTKLVDRRILPSEMKKMLYTCEQNHAFTDLSNTISVSHFMDITGLTEKRFVPDEMIVVSTPNKRTGEVPIMVKLNMEFMEAIKNGKTFHFLGYRKTDKKYFPTETDVYFDKIITTVNPKTDKVFYFGVW